MPIKTEIKAAKTESEALQYPVIMQSTGSELIVLFSATSSGTALQISDRNMSKIGDYGDHFIPATNKEEWEKFTGEITLKND